MVGRGEKKTFITKSGIKANLNAGCSQHTEQYWVIETELIASIAFYN